jgi:hypothetical protein
LTDFAPVPRKYRFDGWTPERQKGFIEALAETGCVSRAAAMVNMAQANCYTLRRAAGAEAFRRAWDAALDFGLKRLKDIAFERAIEGELVPVFQGGKLIGFRRKHNDKLLIFCLRHYGEDANGKRTTINYFSTRASAGAGAVAGAGGAAADVQEAPPPLPAGVVPLPQQAGGGLGCAEASTTTVRTVISGRGGVANDNKGRLDAAAAVLNGFEGVALDPEAEAAIAAAIEACAARARAVEAAFEEGGEAAADAGEATGEPFVRLPQGGDPYRGALVPATCMEEVVPFAAGEAPWTLAGLDMPPERAEIEALLEAKRAAANDGGGEATALAAGAGAVKRGGRARRSGGGG